MDEVQTSKYGFRWQKRKCVDCGKEFIAKTATSVRCIDCRTTHVKEMQRNYKRTPPKPKPQEKDPNICTKIKSCKYGYSFGTPICDYLLITGHRRPCPAGECTVYKRKARKK